MQERPRRFADLFGLVLLRVMRTRQSPRASSRGQIDRGRQPPLAFALRGAVVFHLFVRQLAQDTAQQDHLDEDVLAEHHGHLGWTPLGWPSRASSSKSSQHTGDGPSRSAPFAQHTVSNYSGIGLPGGIQVRILLPALLIERSGRSGFRHFKPYSSVTAYLQPT